MELPEWEEPAGLLDTKPAIDWLTPAARMKFSLSSTFVRPLAAMNKAGHADDQRKHRRWMCRQKEQKTCWIKTSAKLGLFEIQQVFKVLQMYTI